MLLTRIGLSRPVIVRMILLLIVILGIYSYKAMPRYLDRDTWRIGHFIRNIPPGYMESVRTGKCVIKDEKKARLYDLTAIVTQRDIFSVKRLGAIWKLNTGSFSHDGV